MESTEVVYTIGGVKVLFPFKAYPSQLSMMNKIINGIHRSQNCLLESPTGSGKSLALLCSAIAWQKHEEEKRRGTCTDEEERICTCSCADKKPSGQMIYLPDLPTPSVVTTPAKTCDQTPVKVATSVSNDAAPGVSHGNKTKKEQKDDDDEDDFVQSKKRYRTPVQEKSNKRSKVSKGIQYDDEDEEDDEEARNPYTEAHWNTSDISAPPVQSTSKQDNCTCCCHSTEGCCEGEVAQKPKKFPKIYFGTRTHKQIEQIVKELGRTAYQDTDMTILGSREHLCIHPTVSTGPRKNEGCKDLLKKRFGVSCMYYSNVHRMKSQWQLDANGLDSAWDIEDLVRVGKRVKACPYFAVRGLKDEANVVFCPYNYLIDPKIRKSMDIVLKDQIVILDEAHNIEDSSREAASLSVTTEQFEESIAELDKLITDKWRVIHCQCMRTILVNLLKWIESSSNNLNRCDFERESRIWTGVEIVAVLHNLNVQPDTIPQIVHHLTALCEENEDKEDTHALSSNSAALLEGLFVIFEYLFRDNMRFMKDYKIALLRTVSRKSFTNNNGWMSRRRSNQNSFTVSLNFWCMNPAVAFSDLYDIRSIILTSGTLSPMDSFASELATSFPIQLEANHVIHKSQIFVSTVAFGTNGHSLNASYKSSESYSFQDEVGNLLLQVSRIIPYGVLMFFPSYSMMSKLEERWKNTGLWDKLNELKVVLSEPRGNNKNEFDDLLKQFYDVIKECEQMEQVKDPSSDNPAKSGAVFLAVCRGKVSEGMDFTDNNARVVLTVGIPFPNFKDKQVELKRQYNDKYTAEKGLLTGSAWYEIQAYRALNQALGRCIRHKNDWGSLILVDERYGRNPTKYISGLSKWIRNNVIHIKYAGELLQSLEGFAKERKEKQNESLNVSSLPMTPSQVIQTNITHNATPQSPATSYQTNSTTTLGKKPTFAALQTLLKAKVEQNSLESHSSVQPFPQTPVQNVLKSHAQTPLQTITQTPVQDTPKAAAHTTPQASGQAIKYVQPQPVSPQNVIIATEATPKMFQVQQFLRDANGKMQDVRQFVKLAPYQALIKIQENGIDKLLVVDLPKPVLPKTPATISNGLPAIPTVQRQLLVTPAALVPNSNPITSSSLDFSNGSNTDLTNSSLQNDMFLKAELEVNKKAGESVCKKNGIKNQYIKIEYEQPNLEKSSKELLLNERKQISNDLKKTPYKFVDIPPENKTDSPDDVQGTPELFDTESLPSRDASPVMKNEKVKNELIELGLVDDEKPNQIEKDSNAQSKPITRKKLFRRTKENLNIDMNINGEFKNNIVESNGQHKKDIVESNGQPKKDIVVNNGQQENDSIESPLITRRSRRRRLGSEQGKKMRDLLDDLDPSGEEQGEPHSCFEELCCALHHQLSPNLQGLKKIEISDMKSSFVTDYLNSSTKSLSSTCQCPVDRSTTDQYVFYGQLIPDHMTGLSTGQPQIASSGFSYNSYWCEEDNACYQPLFCYECYKQNPQTKMIGVKKVEDSNAGHIWLFTKHLNFCQNVVQELSSHFS
ncbi:Fanconi anemia group J protein homolog [Antedon mediterranea]|uniref:Fanconi anemia group J protein homolog n=1 Tax=Antedon mediterranea TaxID=105859 RepID=UPI003AF59CBA